MPSPISNHLKRIIDLSDESSRNQAIDELEKNREEIDREYESAISALKSGVSMGEGLKTALTSSLTGLNETVELTPSGSLMKDLLSVSEAAPILEAAEIAKGGKYTVKATFQAAWDRSPTAGVTAGQVITITDVDGDTVQFTGESKFEGKPIKYTTSLKKLKSKVQAL